MCGIVGGICNNNITPVLLEGLKRLEYRGYDSAGMVVLDESNQLRRARAVGKVSNLEKNIQDKNISIKGSIGIAHTRWATHGEPSTNNAHPHICNDSVSVVHNGILKTFLSLKQSNKNKAINSLQILTLKSSPMPSIKPLKLVILCLRPHKKPYKPLRALMGLV